MEDESSCWCSSNGELLSEFLILFSVFFFIFSRPYFSWENLGHLFCTQWLSEIFILYDSISHVAYVETDAWKPHFWSEAYFIS